MVRARLLETVKGLGDVYVAYTSFNKQLSALRRIGIQYPISVRDDSYLRLHGISEDAQTGTRTCHAPIYVKDSPTIVARVSPAFEDEKMAKAMVAAHRNNQYLTLPGKEVYNHWEKIVEEDKKKNPKNRRAMFLSQRVDYCINQDADESVFFWQDQRKCYFKEKVPPIGSVNIWQIAQNTVDTQEGTIVNYTWFSSVEYGSALNFRLQDLDCDNTALGVLTPEASAAAEPAKLVRKKISREEMKITYTQQELNQQLKILSELESKVEEVSAFMRKLKQ